MVSKIGNVDTNVISVDGGWVETTNAKRTKFYIFAIINTSIEYIYMCTHTHTQINCSKTNRVEFHELLRFQKNYIC